MSLVPGPQAIAVGCIGVGLIVLILRLTRLGLLSLRFGLGWLVISIGAVVAAAFLNFVAPLASALHMTPTGFLLMGLSGFLLMLSLQLSMSVSSLHDDIRDLSESSGLLEERLQAVERATDG